MSLVVPYNQHERIYVDRGISNATSCENVQMHLKYHALKWHIAIMQMRSHDQPLSNQKEAGISSPQHWRSWQLKACVRVNSIAEFILQGAAFLVVRQLQKVETRGGGWEAPHGVSSFDVKESFQHTPHSISRILETRETNRSCET